MSRRGLSRAQIVTAAVDLADRQGLEAVTLRRIASRLGVHVTSLYNHVPDKEAVLDGIVERLLGEAALPTGTVAWDEWIRRFATAMRRIARRHPGGFAAFHQRPVQGPRAAECTEAGLAAFRDAGFSMPDAYSAIKSASLAVLGLVLDDLARRRSPIRRPDLSALPRERYPLLHDASAVASGVDTWSYLLDALVKGFAANLRESTGGHRAAARGARARAESASDSARSGR